MASNSTANFKSMDYSNITKYLIFTDINIAQLSGNVVRDFDNDLMVECIGTTQNAVDELAERIYRSSAQKKSTNILFLFPFAQKHENFSTNMKKLLTMCELKFGVSSNMIGIFDEYFYKSEADLKVVQLGKCFTTGNEFWNFVDYNFIGKQPRLNYGRCHHKILQYLKKRCELANLIMEFHGANFSIQNENTTLTFERKPSLKVYCLFHDSKHIITLSNNHLHGLYDPHSLFQIVETVSKIQNVYPSFKIEKDQVVFSGSKKKKFSTLENDVFLKIISVVDFFYETNKNFRIQFVSDNNQKQNCFVLNRCLKVSFDEMETFVDNNSPFCLLIKLASQYLYCFWTAPVCCRMQSLASEATVYDFEKFTYLHIKNNRHLYIKIFKLLYSFVKVTDDNSLLKPYLELMPVTLIQRFHGPSIEKFISILENLRSETDIIPLPNGNFKIGNYFNLSPHMLLNITNTDTLKEAMSTLRECRLNILTHEDIEKGFEYDKCETFNIPGERFLKASVINLPKCNPKICNSEVVKKLYVFKNQQFDVFAIEDFDGTLLESELSNQLAVLLSVCNLFTESFDKNVNSLMFPYSQSCSIDITKDEKELRLVLPYEAPAKYYKYWVYNERFLFNHYIRKDLIHDIVEKLKHFEESQGICFAVVKERIVTVEEMNNVMTELDPDNYKAKADYCFYNNGKLADFFAAFITAKNEMHNELDDLKFQVTHQGLIKFNDSIEINPLLLLIIKERENRHKFLNIIKSFCMLQDETSEYITTETMTDIKSLVDTKDFLIPLAKRLNPLLEQLDPDHLKFSNFCCIPRLLFCCSERKKICQTLEELRKKKLRIRVFSRGDNLAIDNCCVGINVLQHPSAFQSLFSFLEKMEKINLAYNGYLTFKHSGMLTFKHSGMFEILDYEDLEKQIFSPQCFREIEKEKILQCLKILHDIFKSGDEAVIIGNRYFQINSSISIYPEDLLKLDTRELQEDFLEGVNFFSNFLKETGFSFPDNWISLTGNNSELNKIEKFKNFVIVDDNRHTYLQLARKLTDSLEAISDVQLLSYRWLKLIPKQLILGEKTHKLLDNLHKIKENGHEISMSNSGTIMSTRVHLSCLKWLQINDTQQFCEFLNIIKNYPRLRNNKELNLFSNNLFSYTRDKEKFSDSPGVTPLYQKIFLNLLQTSTNTLTLNSGINIKLGKCIWIFPEHPFFESIEVKELNKMVEAFDKSFATDENNSMKSILGLPDEENIYKLVQEINPRFTDVQETIANDRILLFPTGLWNILCQGKQSGVIQLFQKLKTNDIPWIIQFNGNVRLSKNLIITFNDLWNLNEDQEKLKEVKALISDINIKDLFPITCKEEVEFERETIERVFLTNILSYNDCVKAKKKLTHKNNKPNGFICDICSNGTLFYNDNLWVRAEDVLDERCEVEEISRRIKVLFPNQKFQYGRPYVPILTSIFLSSDEELFEYCISVTRLIDEKFSQDFKHNDTIKYIAEIDLFRFYDFLDIHPRSFFNLEQIDEVIPILKKFYYFNKKRERILDPKEETDTVETLKSELQNDEIELWKNLKPIRNNRLEIPIYQEMFKSEMKTILKKYPERIEELNKRQGNSISSAMPLENICIQNEYIFKNGKFGTFLYDEFGNGKYTIKYSEENIICAFEFANELDEKFKCKNISDFQSIIEVEREYRNFLEKRKNSEDHMPDETKTALPHVQMRWWLKKVDAQQNNTKWEHKFANSLKGLHHWFKHPDSFENLQDYYQKMNNFYGKKSYDFIHQINFQKEGSFLSREYRDEKYVGYCSVGNKEEKIYVSSFFFIGSGNNKDVPKNGSGNNKDVPKIGVNSSNECSNYLIITDTEFKGHEGENKLNESIVVKTISKKEVSFNDATNYIKYNKIDESESMEKQKKKLKDAEKVENIVLFFPEIIKNENRMKTKKKNQKGEETENTVMDYEKCFSDFQKELMDMFTHAETVQLCYTSDSAEANVEILKKSKKDKVELKEIDKALLLHKNINDLINFLHECFNI